MPQDDSAYMGWLGREAPGILSNNPKDAIGRAKVPMHLIPPPALVAMAKVMGLGAAKYGPYNWRDASVAATVYIAAAQRHLAALLDGENVDPESGAPHTAHVAANMAILMDAFATGNVVDDRPKPGVAAKLMATTPLGGTPMGLPSVVEMAARQSVGMTPMERELFCEKVKELNGGTLPPPPPPTANDFLWYVATPYTACPSGKVDAFYKATAALSELLLRGVRAFSPIAHTHVAGARLPQDHDYWMAVDRPFMDRCNGLLVLRQPGWKESRGVAEEIETFARADKPVLFFDDPNLEYVRLKKSQAADWDAMVVILRDAERSPGRYLWRTA